MVDKSAVLKRKRSYIKIMRLPDVLSALVFLLACLMPLDPPHHQSMPLPAYIMKWVYSLFAATVLCWVWVHGLPALKQAKTLSQLYARGLSCTTCTFICAFSGVLVFLTDSPKLGSPFIVLPYVAVAIAIDRLFILPCAAGYQPTDADYTNFVIS